MSPPSPTASSSSSQPSVVPAVVASGEHYTFGDGATAADRLALLAAAFEPSSARLLRLLGYLRPRCAVDLGCGPGWSTRLVHALLAPATTLGLEQSPEHVARAEATAPPGVSYRVHEVTDVPFPGEPPDFLYSRFLLTHLRDPEAALAAWAEAAADDAVLALEETADIELRPPGVRALLPAGRRDAGGVRPAPAHRRDAVDPGAQRLEGGAGSAGAAVAAGGAHGAAARAEHRDLAARRVRARAVRRRRSWTRWRRGLERSRGARRRRRR